MTTASEDPRPLARFPWRPLIWGGAVLLFLVPVVAGVFEPDGFVWTVEDYVFAAVMIFGSALVMEMGLRRSRNAAYRFGFALALAATFVTVWSNLAVGIIGNEDNPLNSMYFVALLIAVVAAGVTRLKAGALTRVMVALAAAQLLIAAIAQINGHFTWIIAFFFSLLWSASAALFHRAAHDAG